MKRRGLALETRIVDVPALSAEQRQSLVGIVRSAFPTEAAPGGPLDGKWYYDSAPAFVVLAVDPRLNERYIFGYRAVVERHVTDPVSARIGGIGIAVNPSHQRSGVGRQLTRAALDELAGRRFDVALAFLFTPNSARLLESAGFAPLRATVRYRPRTDDGHGAVVVEQSPAWARDVVAGAGFVERIERAGTLDLGVGTW